MDIGFYDKRVSAGAYRLFFFLPEGETGGPADFYYNIVFDGIDVDSTSIPLTCQYEGTCHAIVDSGTSLIVGPAQDIANIHNALNLNPDCSNLDDQPDLVFNIGGIKYTVPPRFYVVRQTDWWGQEQCVAGLSQGGEDFWIFGDAFMRAFYVIFDQTDSEVGLATLADSLNNPQNLRVHPPAQNINTSTTANINTITRTSTNTRGTDNQQGHRRH